MSSTPKRKLCWNCDGSVSLAVDQCTYCGASLKEGAAPQPLKKPQDEFKPPFAMPRVAEGMTEIPQPPFDILGRGGSAAAAVVGNDQQIPANENAQKAGTLRQAVSPLLYLLAGSVFFLFGIALSLFSQNGVFTLQWTTDYWYVYLCGGTVFLIAGWRSLSQVDN
jgi:hypothetical protein